MWKRSLISGLVLQLAPALAQGQDFDIYIHGKIYDNSTGLPIAFAEIDVIDELDPGYTAGSIADANGEYLRELYSNSMKFGGKYKMSFSAEGYNTRILWLDATMIQEVPMELAWNINVTMHLTPSNVKRDRLKKEIGLCKYVPEKKTFEWNRKKLEQIFSISPYYENRIVAHGSMLDSLNALDGMLLLGNVKDHWNDEPLPEVKVHIQQSHNRDLVTLITDRFGFYGYSLPYDSIYQVTYARSDMVSKTVILDLTGAPLDDRHHATTVDIRLFQPIPKEDLTFLKDPIGTMTYSIEQRNFVWNMDLSAPLLLRLNAILARHTLEH